VRHLQRLYDDLVASSQSKPGLLGKLFGKKEPALVKGLYFWGGVGRGKTYLVDTFFDALPFKEKVRTHFHRFMKRVHEEMRTLNGEKKALTHNSTRTVENDDMIIQNRTIRALRTCDDVAWFDFRELCDGPRSQNDYIELGKIFNAVILSGVEQMEVKTDDIARRFINMVDEFYDRGVKLIISAEVELKDLYTGGRLSFEFQRTLSRLLEMQSHEYLTRAHKP